MARTKNVIAGALVVYLALLPAFSSAAYARDKQPGDLPVQPDRARPIDPLPPSPPPPPDGPDKSRFTAIDGPLTVKALNGFTTEALPGYFSHDDHDHNGGLIRVDSPWGEQLNIRYWLTHRGVTFEYDEDLKVRYHFDRTGTLDEIVAESPFREARMAVGKRAEEVYRGEREFSSLDMSAYEVIEEALRAKHSDAFLEGMRQQQGALDASCATQIILCGACIVGWANTIPAIISICVIGGVPTFGAACFLAILAHEAAGFACAVTCVEAVIECRGVEEDRSGPLGCDPP